MIFLQSKGLSRVFSQVENLSIADIAQRIESLLGMTTLKTGLPSTFFQFLLFFNLLAKKVVIDVLSLSFYKSLVPISNIIYMCDIFSLFCLM